MLHLKSIAHHRNGCCGVGFHVVLFKDGKDLMLGVKFDNDTDEDGNEIKNEVYTAVFNVAQLVAGDIAFASNSYRGDYFDSAIRQWARDYEVQQTEKYASIKAETDAMLAANGFDPMGNALTATEMGVAFRDGKVKAA
jgi:hypothetical protein